MEIRIDFLRWLEIDVALKIFMCLEDPADLIRTSAVSRHWQNFVTSNGLSKQLCLRTYPQLACIARVLEPNRNSEQAIEDPSNDAIAHEVGERDHRAYASLFRALVSFPLSYCINEPVSASSTDNYPRESIMKTLDPWDKVLDRYSYWSSKGSDDPEEPETLIYKLATNLCLITEVALHPFQAEFQFDLPIYSSRYVRFRMGHPKSPSEIDRDFMEAQECADDKFVWTYTSQIFPVLQENDLQKFKLPEPVVCLGGFLQVELLGRVQKQVVDGKYYICVAHVQAIGRQLSPAFTVEFPEPSNAVTLKYDAAAFKRTMQSVSDRTNGALGTSLLPVQPLRRLAWGDLQEFMYVVQAHDNGAVEYEWIYDDDDLEIDDDDEADPVFII